MNFTDFRKHYEDMAWNTYKPRTPDEIKVDHEKNRSVVIGGETYYYGPRGGLYRYSSTGQSRIYI